jgi:uncharacterized pyridoxal phosphate-containing UPF0001 family protein
MIVYRKPINKRFNDGLSAVPRRLPSASTAYPATITESVRLIAVTKLLPAEVVRVAYGLVFAILAKAGSRKSVQKQAELADLPDLTWHLIGHLQTNKVRKAVEHFQWIHSVDTLENGPKN